MKVIQLVLAASLLLNSKTQGATQKSLNLYSYRQPHLIKPILKEFTNKTKIKVNMFYVKKGILEKLKLEGKNSPADLILSSDVGRLHDLDQAGLLASVKSKILNLRIPQKFRATNDTWFGLTTRARVIFAHKSTNINEVKNYEDLAKKSLGKKVCIRSGKHVYNISLFAAMITNLGIKNSEQWIKGLKNNLAKKPSGNDRSQAKHIFHRFCDYAIANSYYYGKMVNNNKKPEQKKWAAAIRVIFPNQSGRGTHFNISGGAIAKYSKNKLNAQKLLEFLSNDKIQLMYSEQNYEFPVVKNIKLMQPLEQWSKYKVDSIALDEYAKNRLKATKMVDRVKFNN